MDTLSSKVRSFAAIPAALMVGETPSTLSSSLRLSRSVSVRPDFKGVPVMETVRVPAPREENSPITVLMAPLTMVIREITAVTPIIIPSVVSRVRILLLLIFSRESCTLCLTIPILSIRCVSFPDIAVQNPDDPFGVGRNVGVMGDHNDRPSFFVDFRKKSIKQGRCKIRVSGMIHRFYSGFSALCHAGGLLNINFKRFVQRLGNIFPVLFALFYAFGQKIFDLTVYRTKIILRPGCQGVI